MTGLIAFLRRQFFSVLILAGAAAALCWPGAFREWFGFKLLPFVGPSIQLIMFGMGTTLTARDFESVVKRPWCVGVGYSLGYVIPKLLGWILPIDERDARTVAIEVGMQNGGMAAALAVNVLHSSLRRSSSCRSVTFRSAPSQIAAAGRARRRSEPISRSASA